ncbi:MAG: diguanylate cyclase [Rubrivivax sp.]
MTPELSLGACATTAWQATPDMALRVCIGSGLLALAGWSAARRLFPGQRAFVALCAVMAAWIGFSVSEHAAVDAACKGSIALLSWTAILAQPPLWALFLFQYLHGEAHAPTLRTRVLMTLPSVLLVLAALSNGWHGLWYGARTELGAPIAGLPRLRFDYGPLFNAAVAVGYGWIALAYALTWRGRRQAAADRRTPWNIFLVMMTVPLAANAAYLAAGFRVLGVDPTSIAFAVVLGGFAWMIARNQVFTLVPLARRLLFSELPSAVLVLGPSRRVIDANEAAQQLAGTVVPSGTPLEQWPRFGAALAATLRAADGGSAAVLHLSPGTADERWFDVQLRRLGGDGQPLGLLVQLHDVTTRERLQTGMRLRLAEREAEQVRLRELSLLDPLTEVWNRRALDERFASLASASRPLALVLLDLDHFKLVNDRHGHATGDAVLRDFAAELRSAVRADDLVFRVGGEEFALLLPGLDAAQALRRVQQLHERVNAAALGGLPAGQGFSGGVAATPPHAPELAALLAAADAALYRAKNEGRNRSIAG